MKVDVLVNDGDKVVVNVILFIVFGLVCVILIVECMVFNFV